MQGSRSSPSRSRPSLALVLGVLFLAPAVAGLALAGPTAPDARDALDPATFGKWEPPQQWQAKGEHLIQLPGGKVLAFEDAPDAMLWDPVTGAIESVAFNPGTIINCAGLAWLPDGRLVVNGGFGLEFNVDWPGNPHTWFFDPWTESWQEGPDMAESRYYPSSIGLADGRVLTVSGNDDAGRPADLLETLDENGRAWRALEGAAREMDMFPRLHVLPTGEVVRAAQEKQTLFLDPATGEWREGPESRMQRWGSSSVLMPGGESVLVVGGGSLGTGGEGNGPVPAHRDDVDVIAANVVEGVTDGGGAATALAEVLELGDGTAEWRDTAPMHVPRRDPSGAVLLPDGNVLVVGGSAGSEPIPGWAEFAIGPELYDATTEEWSLMAPSERHRGYHSSAILLPDARVLVAGGDYELGTGTAHASLEKTAEVFSPPYLFGGPRPVILNASKALPYGSAAFAETPDAESVASVVLMRPGTATHSTNTEQRHVALDFRANDDGLVLQGPADGGVAPPGWYMLFLVSEDGVPSVAEWIRVG